MRKEIQKSQDMEPHQGHDTRASPAAALLSWSGQNDADNLNQLDLAARVLMGSCMQGQWAVPGELVPNVGGLVANRATQGSWLESFSQCFFCKKCAFHQMENVRSNSSFCLKCSAFTVEKKEITILSVKISTWVKMFGFWKK